MTSAVSTRKLKYPVIIVHEKEKATDAYSCCSTSEEEGENNGCAMHVGGSTLRSWSTDHHLVMHQSNSQSQTNVNEISASLFDMKNDAQPNADNLKTDKVDLKVSNGSMNGNNSSTMETTKADYTFDVQSYINSLRNDNISGRPLPELSLSGNKTPTEDSKARSVSLTRYTSPRDVLRRVTSRNSTERPNSSKSEPEEKEETKEIEILREKVTSKDLTIKTLREELLRVRSHKNHLEEQLCESETFIERRMAELSKKSDDSHRHCHITKDENVRLRHEMEAKEIIILDLRDHVRRLEMRVNQIEAQKAEMQDKLQVANEVLAAHQSQIASAPKANSFSAPLKHENDLLRQQLERQDREITTLRRELGPARFILDGRNRKSATDKLSVLLESMETNVADPRDLSYRHDVIIQRAKEALNNLESEKLNLPKSTTPLTEQLIEEAFSKPVPAPRSFQTYESHVSNHVSKSTSNQMEQRLYDFLAREENEKEIQETDIPEPPPRLEVPDVLTDSYKPSEAPRLERRSPSVERLLAKYQGGPTVPMESKNTEYVDDFDDGEESPRPDVNVYSLGRKIHDVERGRRSTRERQPYITLRERPKSADIFRSRADFSAGRYSELNSPSPEGNPRLLNDPSKSASRLKSSASPNSGDASLYTRPSSSLSNDRFDAKTYANSLIERYIADRRR